jgi:hypothetical protein
MTPYVPKQAPGWPQVTIVAADPWLAPIARPSRCSLRPGFVTPSLPHRQPLFVVAALETEKAQEVVGLRAAVAPDCRKPRLSPRILSAFTHEAGPHAPR